MGGESIPRKDTKLAISSKQFGTKFEDRVFDIFKDWSCPVRKVQYSVDDVEKGDLRAVIGSYRFLVECKKTTGKNSWTVEKKILSKINWEVEVEGLEPLLIFGMKYTRHYCILRLDDFIALLSRY